MKVSRKVVVTMLVMSLCGCGKHDIVETSNYQDSYVGNITAEKGFEQYVDKDYFTENFSKITYNDIKFQLPMQVAEFEALGFEIGDFDVDALKPEEKECVRLLKNGNPTNAIWVINNSDTDAEPGDCYVYSFEYSPVDAPEATFYADITKDTEEEYVRKFMGKDGDTYKMYGESFSDFIQVDFSDSEVQKITVQTDPTYIRDYSANVRSANKRGKISEDFKEHYNEITIDGKTLKFPISTKEFKEAGFDIQSMYRDEIYCKGERVSGTAVYGDDKFFTIYASQNITDDSNVHVDDGDIISITWDRMPADGVDISFYGGITPDSTRDEVKAVLEESSADDEGAIYKVYLDEDERQGMEVMFIGDELTTVAIYTEYEE